MPSLNTFKRRLAKAPARTLPRRENPGLAREELADVWGLSHPSFSMLETRGQTPEHFHEHFKAGGLGRISHPGKSRNFKQMWQNSKDHHPDLYPLLSLTLGLSLEESELIFKGQVRWQ